METIKTFKPTFFFLVILITIQLSINLLEATLPVQKFTKINKNQFQIMNASFEGLHYLSIGKVRANCAIKQNGRNLKDYSASDFIRDDISLGMDINVKTGDSIEVDCNGPHSGFKPRLSGEVVLSNFYSGKIFHAFRNIIDVYLGLFTSLILLFNLLYFFNDKSFKLISFSISAIIYSISLSYITRLYLQGDTASTVHILTKIIFSFTSCFILISNRNILKLISITYGALLIATLLVPVATQTDLHHYYKIIYPVFPITCLITSLVEMRERPFSSFDRNFSMIFILTNFVDYYFVIKSIGSYNAPIVLSFMTLYVVIKNKELTTLQDDLNNKLDLTLDNLNMNNLNELSKTIANKISLFYGADTYHFLIDDFYSGINQTKNSTFTTITSNDLTYNQIELNSFRSNIKHRYIEHKIEDVGYLFFSSKNNVLNFNYKKNIENHTKNIFKTLSLKIWTLTSQQNQSLTKLKSTLPNGVYERPIGALFIDIVDYTKSNETYGDEFTKFVSSSYFPAMVKYMSSFATPEVVRGDEVFFVVTPELSSIEGDIHKQSFEAIHNLQKFINEVGNKICAESGFPPLVFRMGMTVGTGHIVVDDVQVRTSGDHINRAKRLQDSALKGEILIDGATYDHYFKDQVIPISRKSIIVKKNIVDAVKIGFRKAS
jgi:class 3 adenylate cyclase